MLSPEILISFAIRGSVTKKQIVTRRRVDKALQPTVKPLCPSTRRCTYTAKLGYPVQYARGAPGYCCIGWLMAALLASCAKTSFFFLGWVMMRQVEQGQTAIVKSIQR